MKKRKYFQGGCLKRQMFQRMKRMMMIKIFNRENNLRLSLRMRVRMEIFRKINCKLVYNSSSICTNNNRMRKSSPKRIRTIVIPKKRIKVLIRHKRQGNKKRKKKMALQVKVMTNKRKMKSWRMSLLLQLLKSLQKEDSIVTMRNWGEELIK